MREDRLYLLDILNCIDRIQAYTATGYAQFINTPMIQDAVARNFEIIGEATKQLPQTIKQQYPDVPWRRIAGRDVLIHSYSTVNFNRVWTIVEQELPALKATVESILNSLE